jgi:lipopolysaccharide/colanic/teichoic acid biosynthesis glycosyltransferase
MCAHADATTRSDFNPHEEACMGRVGAKIVWPAQERPDSGNGLTIMQSESIAHDETPASHGHSGHRRARKSAPGAWHDQASGILKRVMDLAIAIPALIFLIPIFLVIALVVLFEGGRPIIFRQQRRGQDGRYFTCYKFRTMVKDAGDRLREMLENDPERRREWEENQKLKDDPRLTSAGGFLRRFSLDELPQLINIIRGDMSIVGPRPIVHDEVRRYGEDIVHYDAVRPGVVGLWQINGRNDTTYKRRVELDVEYAQERSIGYDVMILLKSIPVILGRHGAY